MKRKTLSMAKNTMRRALADLLDPPPSAKEQLKLREHFGDCCCYCGAAAPPRAAHFDHANPGAGNHLGNFLLACARCNGDEKRETPWEEFLAQKCGSNEAIHRERRTRIRDWLDARTAVRNVDEPPVRAAREAVERSIEAYAEAYNELRAMLTVERARPVAASSSSTPSEEEGGD